MPDVRALLKDVETISSPTTPVPGLGDLPNRDEVWEKYRRRVPPRGRQLIRARDATGEDRSVRLWELEGILLDAGLSPAEVLVVVRATVWNKYRNKRRELTALWREIHKRAAMLAGAVAKALC